MASPVPKHLRTYDETATIPPRFREHFDDLIVRPACGLVPSKHPAKYAPGLPTALIDLAGTDNVGDPMAGTGRIAEETGLPIALNDIDPRWRDPLLALSRDRGCEVSFSDAGSLSWEREHLIFSPPYYPRTDRCKQAAHNDKKRGRAVGYRTGYGADGRIHNFVGDPSGVNGILIYRNALRRIFVHLLSRGTVMTTVTKNWTRLGVELRLDLDTILTAQEAGWRIVSRTGWSPPPSLWARYNAKSGTGVRVEDVLTFEHAR